MKTLTHQGTSFEVRAIAPDVLRDLLWSDDNGRPPVLLTDAEGGAPLRCCLRPSQAGEQIALVSYAPLRRWARQTGVDPGPYDEVGPVFIHPAVCGGPDGTGYPNWLAAGRRVLRAYSADGRILAGGWWRPILPVSRFLPSQCSRRCSPTRTSQWCTPGPSSSDASPSRCGASPSSASPQDMTSRAAPPAGLRSTARRLVTGRRGRGAAHPAAVCAPPGIEPRRPA